MAYSYIPQARQQGDRFFDPSMAGPNWAAGLSQSLNEILARKQYMEEEKKKQYQWEQEQDLARRRADIYERQTQATIEQMQKEDPDPRVAYDAKMQAEFDYMKKAYPNLDDQTVWQYVQGGVPKPPSGPSKEVLAREKEQRTNVGKFIDDTDKKYANEITRIRKRREEWFEKQKPPDPGPEPSEEMSARFSNQLSVWKQKLDELDMWIQNLETVQSAISAIRGQVVGRGGEVSGAGMNIVSKISSGINQAKLDPTSVLGSAQGMGAPQGGQPGAGGGMEQLPPEVLKAIQDNPNVPPEEIVKKYIEWMQSKGQTGATGNF